MNNIKLIKEKVSAKLENIPDINTGIKRIISLASATAIVFTSSLLVSKLDKNTKNITSKPIETIEQIDKIYYDIDDLSLLSIFNKESKETIFYIVREINSDTNINNVFNEFTDLENFNKYSINEDYTLFTKKYEIITLKDAYYYSCSFNGTSNYNGHYVHLIGSKDSINLGEVGINYANILTNIFEECPVYVGEIKERSIYENTKENYKEISECQNILIDIHKISELVGNKDKKEFTKDELIQIEYNLKTKEEIRIKKNTNGAHLL